MTRHPPLWPGRPSLPFILLLAVLAALWIAGGASRADALGQAVVRGVSLLTLAIGIVAGLRPSLARYRPIVLLLLGMASLVLLQLVPLPPGIWQSLPGRGLLSVATTAGDQASLWRPLAIVPDAAVNAVASLIVPAVILLVASSLKESELNLLPGIVLALIAASTLLGLLQVSGAGFNNPFINDAPGEVGGSFANRNHFALFLSLGCLLAPVWAFRTDRRSAWRTPVVVGLLLLFVLMILASGSRTGLLTGALAFALGVGLASKGIRRELRGAPAWMFPAIIVATVALISIFVLFSMLSDRAVSIDRALSLASEQDLRSTITPTLLQMIGSYSPYGAGLGGFEPVFRIAEPDQLLSTIYFNHAHNEILQLALEGGAAGALSTLR